MSFKNSEYFIAFLAISEHSNPCQNMKMSDSAAFPDSWGQPPCLFYVVFHDSLVYSKAFAEPWGKRWRECLHGIPRDSVLFQGIPRPLRAPMVSIFIWSSTIVHAISRHSQTLEGTDGVDFYAVFHDSPCYSKAFPDPWGHRRCRFLYGIPR